MPQARGSSSWLKFKAQAQTQDSSSRLMLKASGGRDLFIIASYAIVEHEVIKGSCDSICKKQSKKATMALGFFKPSQFCTGYIIVSVCHVILKIT